MAKKFLSIVLLIACTVIFGSCDDSEYLNVDNFKLDKNLFSKTYTIDEEGCCVLKGVSPIAKDVVLSKVVGYGWQSIGTYEIQDNGKLSKNEYWKDRIGGGPTHYCFESSQQLVQYYYVDAKPAWCFQRMSWSYDPTNGFILCGKEDKLDIKERYRQILKLEESGGTILMYTLQKKGVKNDGKGGYEPFYAMIVYKRMTDEDLKKMKESYTTDRTIPND